MDRGQVHEDGSRLRVLTVCLGNVCRSPLMERLLRQRLVNADVTSAGMIGLEGSPMEPDAAAELVRLGGSGEGFLARRLKPEYVEAADLVLTATVDVRRSLLQEVPSALRRTFTLLEFAELAGQAPEHVRGRDLVTWAGANRRRAGNGSLDVVDPMGQGPEVHRRAAAAIDAATRGIAERLDSADGRG